MENLQDERTVAKKVEFLDRELRTWKEVGEINHQKQPTVALLAKQVRSLLLLLKDRVGVAAGDPQRLFSWANSSGSSQPGDDTHSPKTKNVLDLRKRAVVHSQLIRGAKQMAKTSAEVNQRQFEQAEKQAADINSLRDFIRRCITVAFLSDPVLAQDPRLTSLLDVPPPDGASALVGSEDPARLRFALQFPHLQAVSLAGNGETAAAHGGWSRTVSPEGFESVLPKFVKELRRFGAVEGERDHEHELPGPWGEGHRPGPSSLDFALFSSQEEIREAEEVLDGRWGSYRLVDQWLADSLRWHLLDLAIQRSRAQNRQKLTTLAERKVQVVLEAVDRKLSLVWHARLDFLASEHLAAMSELFTPTTAPKIAKWRSRQTAEAQTEPMESLERCAALQRRLQETEGELDRLRAAVREASSALLLKMAQRGTQGGGLMAGMGSEWMDLNRQVERLSRQADTREHKEAQTQVTLTRLCADDLAFVLPQQSELLRARVAVICDEVARERASGIEAENGNGPFLEEEVKALETQAAGLEKALVDMRKERAERARQLAVRKGDAAAEVAALEAALILEAQQAKEAGEMEGPGLLAVPGAGEYPPEFVSESHEEGQAGDMILSFREEDRRVVVPGRRSDGMGEVLSKAAVAAEALSWREGQGGDQRSENSVNTSQTNSENAEDEGRLSHFRAEKALQLSSGTTAKKDRDSSNVLLNFQVPPEVLDSAPPAFSSNPLRRRNAVCAESVLQLHGVDERGRLPQSARPKDREEALFGSAISRASMPRELGPGASAPMETLLRSLERDPLMAKLDPATRRAIAEAMQLVRVPAGQQLLAETDAVDSLLVVQSGTLVVRKRMPEPGGGSALLPVRSLGSSDCFGTLGLLQAGEGREVLLGDEGPVEGGETVETETESSVWVVDRPAFLDAARGVSARLQSLCFAAVSRVSLLDVLTEGERLKICGAMRPKVFMDGETVLRLGMPCDLLMVVVHGIAMGAGAMTGGGRIYVEGQVINEEAILAATGGKGALSDGEAALREGDVFDVFAEGTEGRGGGGLPASETVTAGDGSGLSGKTTPALMVMYISAVALTRLVGDLEILMEERGGGGFAAVGGEGRPPASSSDGASGEYGEKRRHPAVPPLPLASISQRNSASQRSGPTGSHAGTGVEAGGGRKGSTASASAAAGGPKPPVPVSVHAEPPRQAPPQSSSDPTMAAGNPQSLPPRGSLTQEKITPAGATPPARLELPGGPSGVTPASAPSSDVSSPPSASSRSGRESDADDDEVEGGDGKDKKKKKKKKRGWFGLGWGGKKKDKGSGDEADEKEKKGSISKAKDSETENTERNTSKSGKK